MEAYMYKMGVVVSIQHDTQAKWLYLFNTKWVSVYPYVWVAWVWSGHSTTPYCLALFPGLSCFYVCLVHATHEHEGKFFLTLVFRVYQAGKAWEWG